eukprot:symbB.v1.2.017805.t1/scaffold1391.1/size121936/1
MPNFRQAVAVDISLQLFQRAWCVAELVEARRLRLKQQLVVYSRSIISMEKTSTLKKIRVQDCQASRREDVDEILAKIDDKEKFNQELQGALFEDRDSISSQIRGASKEIGGDPDANVEKQVRRVVVRGHLWWMTTWHQDGSGRLRDVRTSAKAQVSDLSDEIPKDWVLRPFKRTMSKWRNLVETLDD